MAFAVHEQPRAPALAYTVMAGLLPERYFVTPPPHAGALLQVVATDGVSTQWAMSVQQAQALMEPLRQDDRIVRVVPSRYEGTETR